eukprot:CAMPEP_0118651206 /NCGR_PEP_ID=MMETSP0785-20121206/10665_1 /TAXON_ID=91992 /ORGANISM="Bolidomonas pacifica, Strain CCMP 1866" /LENGTH=52 /DNA_ID=CAMNT_0006543649 /DNA_START=189 /DNA_END=347 /DNA_ORIENTATION=+
MGTGADIESSSYTESGTFKEDVSAQMKKPPWGTIAGNPADDSPDIRKSLRFL